MKRLLLPLFFAVGIAGSAAQDAGTTSVPQSVRDIYQRPLTIPFGGKTPYSPQLATLGKMLYFDPRLSGAQNMSCASCHNPPSAGKFPCPARSARRTPRLPPGADRPQCR